MALHMTESKKDNQNLHYMEDYVATQKDLQILKLELLGEISSVKNELNMKVNAVQKELQEFRVESHKMQSKVMVILGSMMVGGFTILGILGFFK